MKNYQISAARAIAGWSQTELAERTNFSLTTVSQVESGNTDVSAKLARRIEQIFMSEGIFFTERGVEKRDTSITSIEGEGWYLQLLDDVYYSMMDKKDAELLIICSDDRKSPAEVNNRYRKIRNAAIRMRQLVEQGNTYLMGPLSEYRYMPKERFSNYVSLIYGDKVAVCTEGNTKAIVFKDPDLAKTWTNLFEVLWGVLKEPEESRADERF